MNILRIYLTNLEVKLMGKVKKFFFIVWLINIIFIITEFAVGRIMNTDFLNTFSFNYARWILTIYIIYDYCKSNLEWCNVDSQMMYVICLIVCFIFLVAGVSFLIRLDLYRISEFSFFIFFSILFRICSIYTKPPNFLILKRQ